MEAFDPYDKSSWFFGTITRAESQSILTYENVDGVFLIRETVQGEYVLSIMENNKVNNHVIEALEMPNGRVMYGIRDKTFYCLSELLEYFQSNVLDTTKLIRPAKRQKFISRFSYITKDREDLSFNEGDILTLLRKDGDEFWTMEDAKGNVGLVPVKYLDLISDTELLSLNPHQSIPQIPQTEVSTTENKDDPCLLECIKIGTEIPSFVWSDVKVLTAKRKRGKSKKDSSQNNKRNAKRNSSKSPPAKSLKKQKHIFDESSDFTRLIGTKGADGSPRKGGKKFYVRKKLKKGKFKTDEDEVDNKVEDYDYVVTLGDEGIPLNIENMDYIQADEGNRCESCSVSFRSAEELATHLEKVHVKVEMNPCDICQFECRTTAGLKSHMLTHLDTKLYRCPRCNSHFRKLETLNQHLSNHDGSRSFRCLLCFKSFNTNKLLKDHLDATHGEDGKIELLNTLKNSPTSVPNQCEICMQILSSNAALVSHRTVHMELKPHKCNECGKRFRLRGSLAQHKVTHSGDRRHRCKECAKMFTTSSSLKEHVLTMHNDDLGKPYACLHCTKRFKRPAGLKSHMTTHFKIENEAESGHRCDKCPKVFKTERALGFHLTIHTGVKAYMCPICARQFRLPGNLSIHMMTHTDNRKHRCTTCDKQFLTSTSLKTHVMNHHTGERPYVCTVCNKGFSSCTILRGHMLIHTGEKPYKCDQCDMAYNSRSGLRAHTMHKHSGTKPFVCKYCDRSFAALGNLKQHLVKHTGVSPFQCDVCKKVFSAHKTLADHMTTHTGERPYKCPHCTKTSRLKCNLTKHIRQAHSDQTSNFVKTEVDEIENETE